MMSARLRERSDKLLAVAALLVAWQLASGELARLVSSPLLVLRRLGRYVTHGELVHHGLYTIAEAWGGLLLGGVPGVALAFVLARRPIPKSILAPFMAAGYGAPKIALAPLFIVWLGIGIFSKIALVASIVFFVLFFMTCAGIEQIQERQLLTARILGANDRLIWREIVWPSALPYIFASLHTALPHAVGAAVLGEILSGNRGLGYLIQWSASEFDPAGVFASVTVLAAIVGLQKVMVDRIERRVLSWRPTEARADDARTTF
jgi:NitT/TauT family transport system permease protein